MLCLGALLPMGNTLTHPATHHAVKCIAVRTPMSSTTSCGWRPLPRAMRMMRDGSVQILGLGLSSSLLVMLSIMHMKRLMRAPPSFSLPWRPGTQG